jgi:hypothetical protein
MQPPTTAQSTARPRSSRAARWLDRVLGGAALPVELMRVVSKSPLASFVRLGVDVARYGVRRKRMQSARAANPAAAPLAAALRTDGWALVPDDWGGEVRAEMRAECDVLRRRFHEANVRADDRYKDIWNYVSDVAFREQPPGPESPFVRYAMQPAILDAVAAYLGETPWLRYILLTESVFQEGDLRYSQKWHLDYDDVRMVKLFVYLSDVRRTEDGPFRLIPAPQSRRVRNSFVHRHLGDADVFRTIEKDAIVDIEGPALRSFLVDTHRVYHCGSRMAPGHTRLLYTALYTAHPSIWPNARDAFVPGEGAGDFERMVLAPQDFHGAPAKAIRS